MWIIHRYDQYQKTTVCEVVQHSKKIICNEIHSVTHYWKVCGFYRLVGWNLISELINKHYYIPCKHAIPCHHCLGRIQVWISPWKWKNILLFFMNRYRHNLYIHKISTIYHLQYNHVTYCNMQKMKYHRCISW